MFTKEELFYIVDCLDQDYYNIKDIEDLELQRAESVSYTHLRAHET